MRDIYLLDTASIVGVNQCIAIKYIGISLYRNQCKGMLIWLYQFQSCISSLHLSYVSCNKTMKKLIFYQDFQLNRQSYTKTQK